MPDSDPSSRKSFLPVFLAVWTLLNLAQAYFTELIHDEAYYWLWSMKPAWGYFDHPPAIALLIKAGYALSGNELGVRFGSVLLQSGTLWLLWRMTNRNNPLIFISAVISISLVHSGFLAVPDVPLLFFAAAFFYFLLESLQSDRISTGILLGMAAAGMLLSKYHGVLPVLFSLIAMPPLLKRKSTWVAAFTAACVFLPHLLWQTENGFPTIGYQLLGRHGEGFNLMNLLMYPGGQLLVFGPLAGFLLLPAALRFKSADVFDRVLKFNLAGILLFFLAASFKGPVEPNWTAIGIIPLILLSLKAIQGNQRLLKPLKIITFVSIPLLLAGRVYMAIDYLPAPGFRTEFHRWQEWAMQVKTIAAGKPVVFMNSYQLAAKYKFYTGADAISWNTYVYSGNQFDLWNSEEEVQGKDVMMVPSYRMQGIEGLSTFTTPWGEAKQYAFMDNFRSYNRIRIETTHLGNNEVQLKLINRSGHPVTFGGNQSMQARLSVQLYQGNQLILDEIVGDPLDGTTVEKSITLSIPWNMPAETDGYKYKFSVTAGRLPAGLNSKLKKLVAPR